MSRIPSRCRISAAVRFRAATEYDFGVLHQHIGVLIDQRLGGVGLLSAIKPRSGPDDLDFDVRIVAPSAEHRRVDAGNYLRDREGRDIAE